MSTEEAVKIDLGAFNFTPDWAKKDAGVTVGKMRPPREEDAPSAPKREGRRPSPNERGTKKPFGARKPFGRNERGGSDARDFARPQEPRLDVEVKVLPETRALGTVIRKLQQDPRAYKFKDLVYFFLDNPESILLRIAPRPVKEGAPAPRPFHQCKSCGFAALSEEALAAHILSTHLSDYYEAREVECEPPKGNFACVAKCGLSGVVLGPPNIHAFNGLVKEMIRTRYPNMTEEEYRSRLEMVRDPEAIEAWRQSATKKTVYVAKGAGEEAPQLSREQAEAAFRQTFLAPLMDNPKLLMITADKALKSPIRSLAREANFALEDERRSPREMCFALRGALHHRKLNFFRANDPHGQEFVTSTTYKEFDAAHAIAELARVANFVAEHPCSMRNEIAPDAESAKHLDWLVSTGHIVSYVNGAYSAVEKNPKYGSQWRKDAAKKPAEAPATAETAAEEPAPAPEAVVEPPAETANKVEEVEEKKEENKDEVSTQLAE